MGSSMGWPKGPELEADLHGWYEEHRQCLSGFPVRELVALATQDTPVGDGHGLQILDHSMAQWISQLNQCIGAYPREPRGALCTQKLESQQARDALEALRDRVGAACRAGASSPAGTRAQAAQGTPETV